MRSSLARNSRQIQRSLTVVVRTLVLNVTDAERGGGGRQLPLWGGGRDEIVGSRITRGRSKWRRMADVVVGEASGLVAIVATA